MKPFVLSLAVLSATFFANCSQLSQVASERSFARVYDESFDKTFEATLAALEAEGFKVALADKQRGVIETAPATLDEQTAMALFDKAFEAAKRESFVVRFALSPRAIAKSELAVEVRSSEKSNGILEQTLLNAVAARLNGGETGAYRLVDVSQSPVVSVTMKDGSTIEGYLLDGASKDYLRVKLKSGGIMHIERSEIMRYSLASERGSAKN